jgi:hypothetical protein
MLQQFASRFGPQLPLLLLSLVQGNVLQLVLHLGPHPHQLVPMQQQLPLVALGQRRHPLQIGKLIFPQQPRDQLRIPPVVLLLARFLAANLGRIPQPQPVPILRQPPLEPQHVAAALHSHHRARRPAAVELLQLPARVRNPTIREHFAALGVDAKHLLPTRMIITPYNQHDWLLSLRVLGLRQPKYRA